MEFNRICRLCGCKSDIQQIFSEQYEYTRTNLRDIIEAVTTVKILKEDKVSTKVCSKCISMSLQMFQFRDQSIKHNLLVKDKMNKLLEEGPELKKSQIEPINESKTQNNMISINPFRQNIHQSIKNLVYINPHIRFPAELISKNINPIVEMKLYEVEDYMESHNMIMTEYVPNPFVKSGLGAVKCTSKQVAVKSTSAKMETPVLIDSDLESSCSSTQFGNEREITDISSEPVSKKHCNTDNSIFSNIKTIAKSEQLHMCNICNTVYSKACHFKKHQTMHRRCHFCKLKFKSIDLKNKHIEFDCRIPKIMKGMSKVPKIILKKFDQNEDVFKEYSNTLLEVKPQKDTLTQKSKIEIEESSNTLPEVKPQLEKNNIKIKNSQEPSSKCLLEIISDNKKAGSTEIKIQLPINIDIGIKNSLNNILDNQTKYTKILQLIIENYKKINNTRDIQTKLPDNTQIQILSEYKIEIKELSPFLQYYTVPLSLSHSPIYNASYRYNFEIKKKVLKHWDDLELLDIKRICNESVECNLHAETSLNDITSNNGSKTVIEICDEDSETDDELINIVKAKPDFVYSRPNQIVAPALDDFIELSDTETSLSSNQQIEEIDDFLLTASDSDQAHSEKLNCTEQQNNATTSKFSLIYMGQNQEAITNKEKPGCYENPNKVKHNDHDYDLTTKEILFAGSNSSDNNPVNKILMQNNTNKLVQLTNQNIQDSKISSTKDAFMKNTNNSITTKLLK